MGKGYTTEWEVEEVDIYSHHELVQPVKNLLFNMPSLCLEFKLKRISDVYTKIFFTPFLGELVYETITEVNK